MFDNMRSRSNEYLDFLESKNAEMIGKINKKGDDMDRRTMHWLAVAFMLTALVVGLLYIVSFVIQVKG